MNVRIHHNVFREFHPEFKVVFLSVAGIDNKAKLKESIHLLQDMEHLVRLSFQKDTFKSHHLLAPWIAARKHFGKAAHHYHTSVEKLLQQVTHHKSVVASDTLTNLVRYISLKYIVPIGIDDCDSLHGGILFNIAKGKEQVTPFRRLKAGALYYRDNARILGTKLDYWKSPKTKLGKRTTSAVIHLEVLPPLTAQQVHALVAELRSLIQSFCGAKITEVQLHRRKNSATL